MEARFWLGQKTRLSGKVRYDGPFMFSFLPPPAHKGLQTAISWVVYLQVVASAEEMNSGHSVIGGGNRHALRRAGQVLYITYKALYALFWELAHGE